ncbi:MAG TPA: iron-containing redox enzyme family protein [Polyangiaceae bacterium]
MTTTASVLLEAHSRERVEQVPASVKFSEPQSTHEALMRFNKKRLEPSFPTATIGAQLQEQVQLLLLEEKFLNAERQKVSRLAAEVPREAQAFAAWFEALREHGPGQFDPLFEFLATRATLEQVRWFVRQEAAGEAGFDDLVSLTQIRMPVQPKLELARNYWDEMGKGKADGMHGPMLAHLAETLEVDGTPIEEIVWESLALANLLVGLAMNRRYAYHSIGALGGVELTAPSRAVRVVEALDRLGVKKSASYYFRLHSTVDIGHWRGWRDNVAIPIVRANPDAAVAIAEGALMRLNAGARTFARYRAQLAIEVGSS